MRAHRTGLLRAAGVLAPLLLAARAPAGEETQKLLASDVAGGDIYGAAVAVDGDVMLVASEYDDDNGVDSGSVYVYRRRDGRWVETAKLKPRDGQRRDNFGRSVALDGDVAVVGAHWDDDNGKDSGSAYVFRFDGERWVEEQKLEDEDGAIGDRFGVNVDVEGNLIAVCAWLEDEASQNGGSVYLFRHDGERWVLEQKLMANDAETFDCFGRYVSLSGDVAVIGAYKEDEKALDAGAAYVFRRVDGSWRQEQKLHAPDGRSVDQFGWATYVDGDVAVVSAHKNDHRTLDAGAAYVFRHDGKRWNLEQKLFAPRPITNELFGFSLALDDDRIVVGAPVNLKVRIGPGAAYVFEREGGKWVFREKLYPSDGVPQDEFGFHLALSGNTAVVGAWRNDDRGTDTGAAYVYELEDRRARSSAAR